MVTGPTRGDQTLDLVFTNYGEKIKQTSVLDPLESDSGAPSDHRVVCLLAELPRYQNYEWVSFSYMRQTDEGNLKFKEWILSQDWIDIYTPTCTNEKATNYQNLMNSAMSTCFPVVTVRRKTSEDPWITDKIRKKIRRRKALFRAQGRSRAWKKLKKVTTKMIQYR